MAGIGTCHSIIIVLDMEKGLSKNIVNIRL